MATPILAMQVAAHGAMPPLSDQLATLLRTQLHFHQQSLNAIHSQAWMKMLRRKKVQLTPSSDNGCRICKERDTEEEADTTVESTTEESTTAVATTREVKDHQWLMMSQKLSMEDQESMPRENPSIRKVTTAITESITV